MKHSLHAAPMSFGNSQYTAPNGLRSNPLADSINPLIRSIPEQSEALKENYLRHVRRMERALEAGNVERANHYQIILDQIMGKLQTLQIQWVHPHFNRQESKRPHHLRHNDKGKSVYEKAE